MCIPHVKHSLFTAILVNVQKSSQEYEYAHHQQMQPRTLRQQMQQLLADGAHSAAVNLAPVLLNR
jgi:hypothetical protein